MSTTIITKGELHSSPPPTTINPRTSFSGGSVTTAQKTIRPSLVASPRVDVEPIYTQLKSLIADNWQLYKQTVADFVIGKRNQSEMAWIIEPFIKGSPQKESLHNQLILAIFANAQRDPPDLPGVASWVSANDKPTTQSKPVTGDAAEQRLKSEIVQLSARERHRLKALQEDTTDGFAQHMASEFAALQIQLPDAQTGAAGGLAKTNWEGEIQKRYGQQLFVESNEFPDPDSIQARMLPICYEEGIFHGFSQGTPGFMNIATEMFVKDMLTKLFSTTRSNGPHWIKTGAYKRRLIREEQAFNAGEVRKSLTDQLPIEQEQERNRNPLSMSDLRLAIDLGGTVWGSHAPISMRMNEAMGIRDDSYREDEAFAKKGTMLAPPKPLTNGILTNGVHHDDEEEDVGWIGGTDSDGLELNKALEDVFAGL